MASNGNTSLGYRRTVERPHLGNKRGSAEDEMVTWLQYPLEYTVERDYCPELYGSLPSSCAKARKECEQGVQLSVQGADETRGACTGPENAEDALALSTGRASGLLQSQAVSNKVKTIMQQTSCLQSRSCPKKGNFDFAAPSSLQVHHIEKPETFAHRLGTPVTSGELASAITMAENHGAPVHNSTVSHLWSSVSCVDVNQSMQRAEPRKEPVTTAFTVCNSPYLTTLQGLRRGLDKQIPHDVQGSNSSFVTKDQMKGAPFHAASPGHWETVCTDVRSHVRLASLPNKRDMQETSASAFPKVVVPSSSGGSQTTGEMSAKEASLLGKQKPEDCDCQSKNAEVDSAETNMLNRRRTKRSRVAESHNLSEKRRRNRINEKLKTLQELIPNSCKADKASILDEAIEYLKALQSQLQMMSTRNGMRLPAVVTPARVQHLQRAQMTPFHPIGIGLPLVKGSMTMGMGLGLMDFSGGIDGRLLQAFPAISPHFNITTVSVASQFVDGQTYPDMELPSSKFLGLQQAPAHESFRQTQPVSHAEVRQHGENLSIHRVSKD